MRALEERHPDDADMVAPLLEQEVAPGAILEWIEWKKGPALACMSERDGLVVYLLGANIKRTFIGHLPGAVVSDTREGAKDSDQGRSLNTTELRIEHRERLDQPLVCDVSKHEEERVEKIRKALLSLARG
jgi:hypothetical protein